MCNLQSSVTELNTIIEDAIPSESASSPLTELHYNQDEQESLFQLTNNLLRYFALNNPGCNFLLKHTPTAHNTRKENSETRKEKNAQEICETFEQSLICEVNDSDAKLPDKGTNINDCAESCERLEKQLSHLNNQSIYYSFHLGAWLSAAKKICKQKRFKFNEWAIRIIKRKRTQIFQYIAFYEKFKPHADTIFKSTLPFSFFVKNKLTILKHLEGEL